VVHLQSEHAIRLIEMGRNTGRRLYPTHDETTQLANSPHESDGRREGHQTEAWLRAEQELVRHYA
jgi:hypothetical protein